MCVLEIERNGEKVSSSINHKRPPKRWGDVALASAVLRAEAAEDDDVMVDVASSPTTTEREQYLEEV